LLLIEFNVPNVIPQEHREEFQGILNINLYYTIFILFVYYWFYYEVPGVRKQTDAHGEHRLHELLSIILQIFFVLPLIVCVTSTATDPVNAFSVKHI